MEKKQFSDLQNHAKSTRTQKRGSGTQVCACPFISPFLYSRLHPSRLGPKILFAHTLSVIQIWHRLAPWAILWFAIGFTVCSRMWL